jgi:hypothetical protein
LYYYSCTCVGAERGSVDTPPDLPPPFIIPVPSTSQVENDTNLMMTNQEEDCPPPTLSLTTMSDDQDAIGVVGGVELDQNGYEIPALYPPQVPAGLSRNNTVRAPYLEAEDNNECGEPIVLHPDMVGADEEDDEDEEEEVDYESSRIATNIKNLQQQQDPQQRSQSGRSDSCDDPANWGIVEDPWAATATALIHPNPTTTTTTKTTTLEAKVIAKVSNSSSTSSSSRKRQKETIDNPAQRYIKERLGDGRSRRSSTGSRSSTKSSVSGSGLSVASTRSTASTAITKRGRGRPPKQPKQPQNLFCYRCDIPFLSYNSWRKHAVYEHIMSKNPYPIVEMNYIDPSTLRQGITLVKCTEELFAKEPLLPHNKISSSASPTPIPVQTNANANNNNNNRPVIPPEAKKPQSSSTSVSASLSRRSSSTSANNEDLESNNNNNSLSRRNSDEGESPKEQLKLRFCKNKKEGTYEVRKSSVDEPMMMPTSPTRSPNNNNNTNCNDKEDIEAGNDNTGNSSDYATSNSNINSVNTPENYASNLEETTNENELLNNTLSTESSVIINFPSTVETSCSSILETRLKSTESVITSAKVSTNNKNLRRISVDVGQLVASVIETCATNLEKEAYLLGEQQKEETLRKDKEIRKDVAECVGDVLQKTVVSIETELSVLEDDAEYELALEMALERSRTNSRSPQITTSISKKTNSEQKTSLEEESVPKLIPIINRPITRRIAKQLQLSKATVSIQICHLNLPLFPVSVELQKQAFALLLRTYATTGHIDPFVLQYVAQRKGNYIPSGYSLFSKAHFSDISIWSVFGNWIACECQITVITDQESLDYSLDRL